MGKSEPCVSDLYRNVIARFMDITPLMIGATILVIFNAISFFMFFSDKRRAKKGSRRTPETTLLWAALFGPIGATMGMILFRHKTRKAKFKLVYVFLLMHTALLLFLIWYYPDLLKI